MFFTLFFLFTFFPPSPLVFFISWFALRIFLGNTADASDIPQTHLELQISCSSRFNFRSAKTRRGYPSIFSFLKSVSVTINNTAFCILSRVSSLLEKDILFKKLPNHPSLSVISNRICLNYASNLTYWILKYWSYQWLSAVCIMPNSNFFLINIIFL